MAKWLHVITGHYHYIQMRQLVHFNTAKSSHRLETGVHWFRPRNLNHFGHSLAHWTWHCLVLWLSLGYFSHLNLYGYGYYTEHLTISWFLYHHNSTIDRQCGQCFSFHRCVSIYLVMAHTQSHLTLASMHFFKFGLMQTLLDVSKNIISEYFHRCHSDLRKRRHITNPLNPVNPLIGDTLRLILA